MSNENPALFEQLQLRQLALPNRIIIAPMCQYSADEGKTTDWHLIHMGHLAQSGCGMLILEATAVEPRGRITHGCLGLYDDETENALSRVVEGLQEVWQHTNRNTTWSCWTKSISPSTTKRRGPIEAR
jgi:2,4-dienoyl-CoA reductase-like NADH-dependent reductase (Old Yellow Enzyme family)